MPRTQPTTTWTEGTSPTTDWTKDRALAYLWSNSVYPWRDDFYPWLFTSDYLITQREEPRYLSLLEMENGLNLELENGEFILSENISTPDNVIDTVWQ